MKERCLWIHLEIWVQFSGSLTVKPEHVLKKVIEIGRSLETFQVGQGGRDEGAFILEKTSVKVISLIPEGLPWEGDCLVLWDTRVMGLGVGKETESVLFCTRISRHIQFNLKRHFVVERYLL